MQSNTYGAASTAFWRHQNFNYTNVDTSMVNHYLSMKELADEVIGVPAELFVRALRVLELGLRARGFCALKVSLLSLKVGLKP
jgi:hypothetical protein